MPRCGSRGLLDRPRQSDVLAPLAMRELLYHLKADALVGQMAITEVATVRR
ncbi:hypothetical protein XHV734_3242 [Xanthomonas hortorum pv. vitians]|nr:hypothetical protein XHV734_3242 [Xanthomonas hortorum pv. vitians]